jgi:hypothetical protein
VEAWFRGHVKFRANSSEVWEIPAKYLVECDVTAEVVNDWTEISTLAIDLEWIESLCWKGTTSS